MATVASFAPSFLGTSTGLLQLQQQLQADQSNGPLPQSPDDVASNDRRAVADKARGGRAYSEIVAQADFRRRLSSVDPGEVRKVQGFVTALEGGPERRTKARQPTSPFPSGPSAAFLAQSLAQKSDRDDEDDDVAEARQDPSDAVAAYRRASYHAIDQRLTILGPVGDPLSFAA